MRLALLIDDSLPDSTRVGAKMMHELAVEFMHHGHEVVVITPGSSKQQERLQCDQIDGVDIWRFKNGPIKDVPKVKRAVNESLLSVNAWRAISQRVKKQPFDAVVYYSPSIFWGALVRKFKKHCQCPTYLILRDLFPQWAIDEGMITEKSPITRYFRLFERVSYQAADHIALMSPKNLELFQGLHPELPNQHVLYNWAKLAPATALTGQGSFRSRLSLEDKVIFFYGGNIGHAQDMANLVRLARGLKNNKQAHFLFVGQGDEVELVQQLVKDWQLDNVTYLPSISQESFKQLLAEVDIGLFSLARNHTAHNFPGKLLGYMVESLPILGSVNPGNDLLNVINDSNSGYAFINGEDDALLAAAKELLDCQQTRNACSTAANELLKETFSVESAAQVIAERLTK